jgi:hypothetical protein
MVIGKVIPEENIIEIYFFMGASIFSIKLQEEVELDSMNHVITQCEDFPK